MNSHKKAYIAALINTIIIGFSFMLVKISLEVASPIDTLAHRFTVAFIVASIPILLGKIKLEMTMKASIAILPLALFYPTLFFMFQAFGLVYTSSSEAGIIQATVPVLTMLMAAYFLNEHSTKWQTVSICLSVVGVMYIFIMNGLRVEGSNMKGTLLILLSALSISAYNVLARKLTGRYPLYTLTYMMSLFGFIGFNAIAIVQHILNQTVANYFEPFTDTGFLLSILYLGVLSSLCTSILTNYALSKMEAFKMSVFGNFSTVITIMAGILFLNEKIHYYHLIGTAIILLGIFGTNYFGRRETAQVG